jgi:hypothetical protein
MWRKYNLLPPPGFKLRNGHREVKLHKFGYVKAFVPITQYPGAECIY